MTKYITEILDEINKNTKAIEKYKDNPALRYVFSFSFEPSKKFILPEGVPDYKKDLSPLGMSPINLYMETKKFYIYCRADLTKAKREGLFVELIENLHASEVDLMVAIKDQQLTALYPNITAQLAYNNGFIKELPIPVEVPVVAPIQKQEPSPSTHKVYVYNDSDKPVESTDKAKKPTGRPRKNPIK